MHKYSRPGAKIKQGLSEVRAVFENPSLRHRDKDKHKDKYKDKDKDKDGDKYNSPYSSRDSVSTRPPPGPPPVPPEAPPEEEYDNPPPPVDQYQAEGQPTNQYASGSNNQYQDDRGYSDGRGISDGRSYIDGRGYSDGRGYQQDWDGQRSGNWTPNENNVDHSLPPPPPSLTESGRPICSIQRNPRFNPDQAAKDLRQAMDGKGVNEEVVIQVLTDHNNAQRQEIKNKYRNMFGKELDKELKKELKGKLESVVMALLTPPREYLAHELRGSMKGLGTDEQSLIDIMMPRTNREVKILKDTFKQVYGRDLEKDIHSETSGQFREVLIAQAQGNRDTTEDVMVAIRDAEELTMAHREKKWGSDSVLYRIMFKRSHAQMRAIFKLYENATGQDIEDSIKQRTKGDLENSLIGMARASKGIRYFYATRLYEAMKGKGMNDEVVIRTLVSRSEIDLGRVAEEYQRLFHQSLSSAIAADTKGSYQTVLLRLLA